MEGSKTCITRLPAATGERFDGIGNCAPAGMDVDNTRFGLVAGRLTESEDAITTPRHHRTLIDLRLELRRNKDFQMFGFVPKQFFESLVDETVNADAGRDERIGLDFAGAQQGHRF